MGRVSAAGLPYCPRGLLEPAEKESWNRYNTPGQVCTEIAYMHIFSLVFTRGAQNANCAHYSYHVHIVHIEYKTCTLILIMCRMYLVCTFECT
jgi:hypothetical protein